MADWPRWSLTGEPQALTRYVLPESVAELVQLPGASGDSRRSRLAAVYGAIARVGIGYAVDEPSDEAGRQVVRSPAEVLWAPRHGTCLDLALVFAAACLKAGLHPVVAILDAPSGLGPGHAVVLVRLDQDLAAGGPGEDPVWVSLPEPVRASTQPDWDSDGDWVVVDPVGLSRSLGTARTRGLDADLPASVASGGRYLLGGADSGPWTWRVGVDIGSAWRRPDAMDPGPRPGGEPLRPPYRAVGEAPSPLRLLRAEYGLVPFQARDELTILTDWCRRVAAGDRTGISIVDGVGGAGKTRLALELATRLRREGWYAGLLPTDPDGVDWLASVVSPVLVLVDYADGRLTDTRQLLKVLRRRLGRGRPAVVVLTARAVTGDWVASIEKALDDDRHPYRRDEDISLPTRHPRAGDIYQRARAAVLAQRDTAETADSAISAGLAPAPITWTTLDLVLLGWLAADSGGDLPSSRSTLYEEVLTHESNYWAEVYPRFDSTAEPDRRLLLTAAGAVSLVAPSSDADIDHVLLAVPGLDGNETLRRAVRRTLSSCLDPAAGEGLALRPDPVADHLVLSVLADDPGLLDRLLPPDPPDPEDSGDSAAVVRILDRAGQLDSPGAVRHLTHLVEARPARWRELLDLALTRAGSALAALTGLAMRPDTFLPLDDLSAAIPFSSYALYDLGLQVDQRRLHEAGSERADPQELIELLQRVAERSRLAGDRAGALAAATETAQRYRDLAAVDPAGFLPELAGALNNLSNRQGDSGDRTAALASITEAVQLYRDLAQADPTQFGADLAGALNNLANRQGDSGDRTAALASITEAVQLYRDLAQADPAAFLPDLASALNNLGIQQSDNGDRAGALASVSEAVHYQRELTATNPAAFLPDLAKSLNNLSNRQADSGDRTAALASISEAVQIRRDLATANPAAFRPDLAGSLNNLSTRQAESGDRPAALASITEAVQYYRDLAGPNPAAFLPDLAMTLNNLSNQQAESGDRATALASITEAVQYYRDLATANPAAFRPDLAMTLNNLANRQGDSGDRAAALAAITEALQLRRDLAAANPARFRPDLAMTLNNLSVQQSHSGDRTAALAAITEAVQIRRDLAAANPAAFRPDLAMTLSNLSVQQSQIGDHAAALASVTEAVQYYRELAAANPAAFRPYLAGSLNNLSVQQSRAGDRAAALASITEAVQIRRDLAAADPAAFRPDLAGSLNNLSNRLADSGDRTGALAAITEAVQIRRDLAAADPAAFLPDLAMTLNNLSSSQADSGDRTGALASITEAVQIRRDLAAANPAAYRPDLAGSLNNLANRQSESGDPAAALASITEAVQLYRDLAAADPAAFRPDLAMTLNNLSTSQADSGDRTGALASITEAVQIRRDLAAANPAAFRPDLAGSLNNLANRQSTSADPAAALASITEAVQLYGDLARADPAAFLPSLAQSLSNLYGIAGAEAAEALWRSKIAELGPGPARGELRVELLWRVAQAGRAVEAAAELATAVRDIDAPTDDAPGSRIVVSRARSSARSLARELEVTGASGLPTWVWAPLSDQLIELVNHLQDAADWPAVESALADFGLAEVSTSGARQAVEALLMLYPSYPGPEILGQVQRAIDERGLDAFLDGQRRDHAARATVWEWLQTATWDASRAYFDVHTRELTGAAARAVLAEDSSEVAEAHLALLNLIDHLGPDTAFASAADPSPAEEAAGDAIDAGQAELLPWILQVCPALRPASPLLAAVSAALLDADDVGTDEAVDVVGPIRELAEAATPVARRALAVRLRGFRQHRPEHPGIDELIALVDVPRA